MTTEMHWHATPEPRPTQPDYPRLQGRQICRPCSDGDHSSHQSTLVGICVGCVCPSGPRADEPKVTADDAKATNHPVTRVSTVSLIVCDACGLPAEHQGDGHVHTDTGLISVMAPEHTQVRIQVWYSVRCARCDDDWFEDLDATPGGYTESRALLDVVRDWGMHQHTDGKLYCAQCFKVMTCEVHGHTWELQWLQSPDGNEQFRWCEHCGDTQVRPIEVVELP